MAHVDATLAHVDATSAHMDATLAHMNATLAHMDVTLAHMDATLVHMDASSPVCGHCAKCYHPLVRSQVAVGFAKNQDNMDGASFHFAAEAAASSFSTSSPNNYLESSTCTVMDRLALMSDAAV